VILLAAVLIVLVVRLVRRAALRDSYAMLWMVIAALAGIVAVVPAKIWDGVALAVGIRSGAPTLFLLLGVFGLLILIMQLSIAVTRLERLTTRAIVENAVKEMEDPGSR
jgi:hypothetical protein